jgi:hypothetical protein
MDIVQTYDPFYGKLLGAQLKFAWLPQTCNITGKRIWLKFGYRLTAMWTGPGDPLFEHRWHDKLEHIIWKLKR